MTHSSLTLSLLSALAITAGACNNSRQDAENPKAAAADSSYTLTGKIAGLDSSWVYLQYQETDSMNAPSDSTRMQQGVFTFKGFIPRPQFVMLEVRGLGGNANYGHPLEFFLDKGVMMVNANKDTLYKASIIGSHAQDEYLALLKSFSPIEQAQSNLDSPYQAAKKTMDQHLLDSLLKIFNGLEQQRKDLVKQYVLSHPASYIGAYEIVQYFSYLPEPGPLDTIYRALDPAVQASYYGKKIKDIRETARLLDIGQPAPDFTQNDANDQPVALASFKDKYTLVNFWASWCGPCRRESPSLVKTYRRFKSKGFEIVGVSLDDNKKNWLDAITKDKLSWTQLSDLKGGGNEVARLYGITAIPMNFLLDPQGHIVAKGFRGGDLEKKLAELLPNSPAP